MPVLGILSSAYCFSPLMAFALFFLLLEGDWTACMLLHLLVLLESLIPSGGTGSWEIRILVSWTFKKRFG